MRRRNSARTQSSPERGMPTYLRSVMDRARVANKRSNFRNRNYDYYDEREDRVEDYTGEEPFFYKNYEEENYRRPRSSYRGREEDEYLDESDSRNYSRRKDEYGDIDYRNYSQRDEEYGETDRKNYSRRREQYRDRDERNYTGQNEAGFLYHMERRSPSYYSYNEHGNPRSEDLPPFNDNHRRKGEERWWKGRRQY